MPTYISLLNFTDQGIEDIGNAVMRVDSATERAEQYNCKLLQSYWTVGPYDLVFILEARDDESATTFLLDTAAHGEASGRLRFVLIIAKRCRASLGGLVTELP